MLIADAQDDERPRIPLAPAMTPTPAERAAASVLVAAAEFNGPFVCRACALTVVAQLVRIAVEAAERDLRARFQEQMQCPN